MIILIADPSHAEGIRKIYAPFVEDSLVTFETQIPDSEVFTARILQYTQKYPWLVMVEEGKVIGYAYAAAYRERIAYQWVTECSVYVDTAYRNKGIAARLYRALFELLKLQGFYKVYAVITIPNAQSTGFHEKMGFEWFATYQNVGYKAGKWCHVGWWQLTLREPAETHPLPPTPFSALSKPAIENILKKYAG